MIGDSAPYGVYVPVIEWLSNLALAAGFHDFRFEKTRDRNVKWKNRKHRVPLCEGPSAKVTATLKVLVGS